MATLVPLTPRTALRYEADSLSTEKLHQYVQPEYVVGSLTERDIIIIGCLAVGGASLAVATVAATILVIALVVELFIATPILLPAIVIGGLIVSVSYYLAYRENKTQNHQELERAKDQFVHQSLQDQQDTKSETDALLTESRKLGKTSTLDQLTAILSRLNSLSRSSKVDKEYFRIHQLIETKRDSFAGADAIYNT